MFPKVLLFHLPAPFLNRLPMTMIRVETNVAFATIPTQADAACRSHCTLQALVRCQCKPSAMIGWHRAAMWALRPHQQAWTWLPSQPTGKRTRGWLLVRSSMAMSCWWVHGFPKMYDLNESVHMKGAQLQPQHSNGNTGMDTGPMMQQSISPRELCSCA